MNRGIILLAVLLAPFAAQAQQGTSVCQIGSAITDPPALSWTDKGDHYLGTLEYGEATFLIDGKTLTTRAYRQQGGPYCIPGPTLNMKPGKKYVLRFRNLLPYEAPSPDHNVMKDPNITNLHTHGLHISGESPGDDVTRFFEGGRGGDFVYDIPSDHMGGTYWYHAHHHGSTFLQVSTGGFGLIVIDDANDGLPSSVAAMHERPLLIGLLNPGAAGTGGDTLVSGTLGTTWSVNGVVNGSFSMPANEWEHWRVLLADADARPKTITIGGGCEVQLMARDGVWRTQVPKQVPTNSLVLTGASRADLAVRCTGNSSISVGNTLVANVTVGVNGDTGPNPFGSGASWTPKRPAYLRDLRGVAGVNRETVRMGARTINGSKFDHMTPTFELSANSAQEWSLNGAAQHPFHLHVYHVQIAGGCSDYEDGEYYDVVANNCTLRFDLNQNSSTVYNGRTIMHCHVLEHEDQGAMGWLKVNGGIAAPTYPGTGYSAYYVLNPTSAPPAAPSNLVAAAASSSAIDLTWQDNADNETGFDIHRSSGSAYSVVGNASTDSTSYSDTGLEASTPYQYYVSSKNEAGSADSNIASATTLSGGSATTLVVGSITVSAVNVSRGTKAGQAVVAIRDNLGAPVSGATVTGDFTGTFVESGKTGNTGSDGSVTFTTSGSAKGSLSVTFCVTGVTGPLPLATTIPVCGSL